MTPRIEKLLFDAAANLADSEERREFLNQVCGKDEALKERLEELLSIRRDADDFFEFEPEVTAPDGNGDGEPGEPDGLGARIGRYRLIERIGAGGYGVVYLAEQLEPVRRKVALKIVRLGMDTESVVARFEAERQALASMEHRSIARVLDAGATSSGRPYFVMELVDGERITDYCDRHRLDVRQRLELFVKVCRAIQHAHQKGVIHRDLKPSNILVRERDGTAIPKVIDFGIAKATGAGVDGSKTVTSGDQLMGTPAYMSPEQAVGGGDIDTRSDIYSLGVMLFELLAGRQPYDAGRFTDKPPDEIRRMVREVDCGPPSGTLKTAGREELRETARLRRTDSQKLLAMFLGDLDWIVMKAMEKDRQRRYDTANGLALDVERFLSDVPVSARPPSRGYLLRKWIRRNKIAFTAGSVALTGLVGGLGVSTWLFVRERHASSEQERLRHVAEEARTHEAHLRRIAEYRGRVAEAAVRVSHGEMERADRLVSEIPVEQTPSSLETFETFRKLAEWHLKRGHMEALGSRYLGMAYALASVDSSDTDKVSINLLPAASAVCLSGDDVRYEWFREMAIRRFANTTNPVVAEQVLKACLLKPADDGTLEKLRPLAGLVERALREEDSPTAHHPDLEPWSYFALALMSYRDGSDRESFEWAKRSLSLHGENPATAVSTRILLALIEQRAGRKAAAEDYLRSAAKEAAPNLTLPMRFGWTREGFWFDWVNVRILLEEAGWEAATSP